MYPRAHVVGFGRFVPFLEKREEIWLGHMTKTRITTENLQKQSDNTKNIKSFDYKTIADLLRTVTWSNNSNPTGVAKPDYRIPTFPQITKAV